MTDVGQIMTRPIAHRGYHNIDAGVIENTPTAIAAAVEKTFAIEVDVQETADGDALVFHDYTLDRLTEADGRVIERPTASLTGIAMKEGGDRLWLLQDLFDLVDGRVPLVIEIKSLMRPGAQADFVRNVVDRVAAYKGPAAIKSFDPDMLSIAKAHRPHVLRGIVSEAMRPEGEYMRMTRMERFILSKMLHLPRTRPHFISYGIRSLPAAAPSFCRKVLGLPVMTWTVRTRDQRDRAARYADQIVFEGFDPDAG
ncbi:glycerophosphodiester phosphodiesterase family protein [Roseibium aggregatum]|uniref:Glycerophosphodiester phosphodiesterase n=1 Tax=Roseibium aggregatum TaxID=187304 RepID=A0A926P3F4_9HYPH|nr:glycerophosphodiester phosphodiesterase family protein [Roseibium aggregatum]MBD1545912.1 glycerophosphodiester phosphodiesterase [Roseibium aggregatum]